MNGNALLAGGMAAAALCFGLGFAEKPAQAQKQQSAGPSIAVINVQKVFKDNTKFKNLMDQLKADVESKDKELRAKDDARKAGIASLQQVTAQADRDRIEKQVRDLQFEMEKTQKRYQQEFMTREADIYSTVYREMTDLLTHYCQQYQILLVLRATTESDPGNPQAVLQLVYRDVVYHHPHLDLTEVISNGLNQQQK